MSTQEAEEFVFEYLPQLYYKMFKRMMQLGFHRDEALKLVRSFIISQGAPRGKVKRAGRQVPTYGPIRDKGPGVGGEGDQRI